MRFLLGKASSSPRSHAIGTQHIWFDVISEENEIEHRLTKSNHPWTNGQLERMHRTTMDAEVKLLLEDNHDQLRIQRADFMGA